MRYGSVCSGIGGRIAAVLPVEKVFRAPGAARS